MEYINHLHDAIQNNDREETGLVIEQMVEYTLSHFAFEEDLQEQAGYPFLHTQRKVHQLFTRKMADFLQRFELGEDVARPLLTLLRTWLVNHIKRDDHDYADAVQVFMETNSTFVKRKKGFFARLFG